MLGILKIAYKLLVNDKAKFVAFLAGISFTVFLMVQMALLFSGMMSRASATVDNVSAKIWVMDPSVQTVANTIPLPDFTLDQIRSIPGVEYAVPPYSSGALIKLESGIYVAMSVIGLDNTSPMGRPILLTGNIQDILAENRSDDEISLEGNDIYHYGCGSDPA